MLANWEYSVITVVIDKYEHKIRYTVWRYDPYHYCLTVMLERYVLWLRRINAVGDVMSESRGGREDRRLKDSFTNLLLRGTDFISGEEITKHLTSRQLKVKSKANNTAGLQLADLIAHPAHVAAVAMVEQRALPTNFGARIAAIVEESKYLRHPDTGRIDGWGRKWLP